MRETAMMAGARSILVFRNGGGRDEIRDVAVDLELEGVGEGIESAVEEKSKGQLLYLIAVVQLS